MKKLQVYTDKEGRKLARVKDLTPNPYNADIYGNETEEQKHIEGIKKSMIERRLRGQTPNFDPIPVFKDGTLEGGHSRVDAAKRAGIEWVMIMFSDSPYPDMEKVFDNRVGLIENNLYRRDRGYSTAYYEYLGLYEGHIKQFGHVWSKEVENKWIEAINGGTKFPFGKSTINKLKKIVEIAPEYLHLLDTQEMNLTEVMKELKDKSGIKDIADPERYIFHDAFQKYPSIARHITKRTFSLAKNMFSAVDYIMFDEVAGWETQFIGGMLSNIIMSAVTEAMNKTGVKQLQAISAGAATAKTYADVGFPVLDDLADRRLNDPGYQYFPTNIEIKVAQYAGNCGDTYFEANWGISKKGPQEFIMTSYAGDLNKFVMMLVTIDGKNWNKSGKKARISLAQLYKLCPTYLLGEMFKGKRKIEVQWGDA